MAEVRVENSKIIIDKGDRIQEIPIDALGSYSELLGYSCPRETLEAILDVIEVEEPEPDPETGENVWTDSYTLLTYREQEREREAFQAVESGTAADPRTPQLRSTMAATNAVHRPIDGGECALDRCRRTARDRMGLAEPTKKAKASSRVMTFRAFSEPEEKTQFQEDLESVLGQVTPQIDDARRRFLHGLTGNSRDPLEPEVVETPPSDPVELTLQKYGGSK